MASGYQTQVYQNQAVAVEGDFATINPRFTVLAGPGGLIAGPTCLVGRFGWLSYSGIDYDSAQTIFTTVNGTGAPAGFVGRKYAPGLITNYLSGSTMQVPIGFPMVAFSGGDFFVMNRGSTQALPGMKAYVNFADGSVTFQATGSAINAASGSTSSIAAGTATVTGSITNNTLTVTAVTSGTLYPGSTLAGTDTNSVAIATGTKIVSQLTSTAAGGALGGTGTYAVDTPEQTVGSCTITATYGTLTVGGTVVSGFEIGSSLTGTGVVAGTAITALGTGSGGAGTYIVNNNTVVASTAITAATQIETKWFARSSGLANELVKISDHAYG